MEKCKKRPITAHLRTKNKRYYAVFSYSGKDGELKETWRTLELEAKLGNKRKAQEKMEEMKYQFRGVLDVPGYEISFVDYLSQWKKRKEGEVEDSTYESIRRIVYKKIIPYFEDMNLSLSEIKPMHIHHFYEHLYKNGRANGKGGLSISSIKTIKSMLNEAFKKAVIEELIDNNPVESVKLPAKDNPRKPHVVLDKESANRMLGNIIDDELMYPLLLTVLRYGLRRSEVAGLKWGAIDFQKNLLRIESVIVSGKNPEKNKTKTKTSNAAFPLLPDIKEVLMIRKQAQDKYREMFGEAYVKTDYVFTYEIGKYLNPDWITRRFKKILSKCRLPDMRFHDLRHTTACILHDKGMRIKELQRWMRHGKIEMTADVYLHISYEREKELAYGLQNLFSGEPESKYDFIETKPNLA